MVLPLQDGLRHFVAGNPDLPVRDIAPGTVHDLVLHAGEPGDHAYRSGVFRWAVEQGMWGILRIGP